MFGFVVGFDGMVPTVLYRPNFWIIGLSHVTGSKSCYMGKWDIPLDKCV